jgi:hypothetical protein
MKSLEQLRHLFRLQYTLLLVTTIVVVHSSNAQVESAKGWYLPKHQINLLLGTGTRAFDGNHNLPGSNSVVGIAYNYNLNTHFYASFDYQFCFTNFDLMTTKRNFTKPPTTEFPVKVEVVNWSYTEGLEVRDIEPNLYALTNNDGYSRRQNVGLSVGYMRVTTRNILRIGLGYGFTSVSSRYAESRATSIAVFHTLNFENRSEWIPNMNLSYDFFITQQFSIGVRLSAQLNSNTSMTGCLALGYAPTFKQKTKKNPRV